MFTFQGDLKLRPPTALTLSLPCCEHSALTPTAPSGQAHPSPSPPPSPSYQVVACSSCLNSQLCPVPSLWR